MVDPTAQDLDQPGARPYVDPATESTEQRQKKLIHAEDERVDEVEEVGTWRKSNLCSVPTGSARKMLTPSFSA